MICKKCNKEMQKKTINIRDLAGFEVDRRYNRVKENSPYKNAIYVYYKCATCGKETKKKLQ